MGAPGAGGDGFDAGQLPRLIERGAALRQAMARAGGPEALLASRRDLARTDQRILLAWRDNAVRGVFEVRSAGRGSATAVTVLNLVDDLEYRVYGLPGPVGSGTFISGTFISGTLLPLTDDDEAWLASGAETAYPPADARRVARLAIDMATREPDLVFRNPERVKQGWEHMRKDREEFLAFFGADELVLPTAEAEGRLNSYYKRRQEAALAARAGTARSQRAA